MTINEIQEEIIEEPFDFSQKNFISIPDLNQSLKTVIFPDEVSNRPFNLKEQDYELLYKSMSMMPGESEAPVYDETEYYDSYVKFFLFGDKKDPIPDHIRIFNKVGYAYGYLTDCAYIVDFENKVDFFLTATIHVNENQTYNDGVYEYDEIGIPFLSALGRKIYEYELGRERSVEADLSKFDLNY